MASAVHGRAAEPIADVFGRLRPPPAAPAPLPIATALISRLILASRPEETAAGGVRGRGGLGPHTELQLYATLRTPLSMQSGRIGRIRYMCALNIGCSGGNYFVHINPATYFRERQYRRDSQSSHCHGTGPTLPPLI